MTKKVTALLFAVLLSIVVVGFALVVVPALAQNAVPPTAREAATLPAYASRLHPSTSQAKKRSPAPNQLGTRLSSPQDQIIYENGPVNGTTDAWTINFGYVVSDSFANNSGNPVSGFDVWVWEYPGDVVTSVGWSVTSGPNGGTVYGSGTASVTDQFISTNQFGYNIDKISVSGLNVTTGSGTFYLNLQNASVPTGDPVFWDENSGADCHSQGCPSQAYESSTGTIPSEAFDVEANCYPNCTPECVYDLPQDGFKIIHDFTAKEQPPNGGLAIDPAGKLYGTTGSGGDDGLGLAYKLEPNGQDWIFTPLYSFTGGADGQNPLSMILGPEGALYGIGGKQYCNGGDCGLIFNLKPSPTACLTALCSWSETVLYRFTGDPDGSLPNGNLVFDQAGNFYGITFSGGAYGVWGTAYELTPSSGSWTEKVLYSFTGGSDGGEPTSLLLGHDGNLYGTTQTGGDNGYGVIFQLVPSGDSWEERVIASFGRCSNPCPRRLIQERSGSFYGISSYDVYQCYPWGCNWNTFGTIFTMSPSGDGWQFSTLYDIFIDSLHGHGLSDYGFDVFTDLAIDPAGNLYATEGSQVCCVVYSSGVIKLLQPHLGQWLVGFDGYFGNLEVGASGKLYGTTGACGGSEGTVWQLTPQQ